MLVKNLIFVDFELESADNETIESPNEEKIKIYILYYF